MCIFGDVHKEADSSWHSLPSYPPADMPASCILPIPRLQHQSPRSILAELFDLFLLEHAEGLAGEVRPVNVGRVEDVAQLVAGQAVELRDARVEFGADVRTALLVPAERRQREAVARCEQARWRVRVALGVAPQHALLTFFIQLGPNIFRERPHIP